MAGAESIEIAATERGRLEPFWTSRPHEVGFLRDLVERGSATGVVASAADGGAIEGVAARGDNGILHLAGALDAEAIRRAAAGAEVAGIAGRPELVAAALAALGWAERPLALSRDEEVLGLELAALVEPEQLRSGEVVVRRAEAGDAAVLAGFRVAFWKDVFGMPVDDAQRARAEREIAAQTARRALWIAIAGGQPSATVALHLQFADMVVVGGGYSVPGARNHGYGRSACAGALLAARAEGVRHAVVYTVSPATVQGLGAIGFARVGGYRVVLFAR